MANQSAITAVTGPAPGRTRRCLRGSPGSHFTSGSNRFRPCAGAAADVPGGALPVPVPPARYGDGHSQVFEQSTTCGSCPLVSGSHAQRGDRKQRRTRENTTSTNGRCRRRSRGADSRIARAGRGNVAGRQQPQPGRKHVFPAECHLRRLPYPGLGGRPDPGSGQRRRLRNADRGVERLHLERRSWRPGQRLRILAQRCLRVRPQRHLGRRPERWHQLHRALERPVLEPRRLPGRRAAGWPTERGQRRQPHRRLGGRLGHESPTTRSRR